MATDSAAGESAGALVQGQLQNFGTNVLWVLPGTNQSGGLRENT